MRREHHHPGATLRVVEICNPWLRLPLHFKIFSVPPRRKNISGYSPYNARCSAGESIVLWPGRQLTSTTARGLLSAAGADWLWTTGRMEQSSQDWLSNSARVALGLVWRNWDFYWIRGLSHKDIGPRPPGGGHDQTLSTTVWPHVISCRHGVILRDSLGLFVLVFNAIHLKTCMDMLAKREWSWWSGEPWNSLQWKSFRIA